MERIDIFSEKLITGYLRLSAIVQGRYYERKYQGYRKREAMQMFRAEVLEDLAQNIVEQR